MEIQLITQKHALWDNVKEYALYAVYRDALH